MMATVPHVTSGLGLRKFQADGILLTRVYNTQNFPTKRLSAFKLTNRVTPKTSEITDMVHQ